MKELNLIQIYEKSFQNNWSLNALTDYNENLTYTYGEVAKKIAQLHLLFHAKDIKKGDKIALIGINHSSWVVVFMATITYGAVIVPVLPDYHPSSIENIIEHSDAKAIFIDEPLWQKIDYSKINHPVIFLKSMTLVDKSRIIHPENKLEELFKKKYKNNFSSSCINYPFIDNKEVVCLQYVSGASGFIKAAMLTAENFLWNIVALRDSKLIQKGESNVVFLPLAHVFGCTGDILYCLSIGVHSYIMNQIRSTQFLIGAFKHVQPRLINSVPLIIEKIATRTKEQFINTRFKRFIIKVPFLNRIVFSKIRKKLIETFGGKYRELLIGGAPLDTEVEDFLWKIRFPFSVAYGLSECAPMVSMDRHKDFVPRSSGTIAKAIEVRINSSNPSKVSGEIQVKGKHVMKGYYKDPVATSKVFTKDGWLRTGDLGIIDSKNKLYIKGLLKTMLLGSNGQNIFQEEIEAKLNKLEYVSESMIVMRNSRLVALVYLNIKKIEEDNISIIGIEKVMNNYRTELNNQLARFEYVSKIEIVKDKFIRDNFNNLDRSLYG